MSFTPDKLAIEGGTPVRQSVLPYGRQDLDEPDIAAVVEVLRSDYLTTGPVVSEFESTFAARTGAKEAVALSSGTAGLHAAMYALEIGPGDEVIVPPITFVATANCVIYQGGIPVFADVDPATLLLDPDCVEDKITSKTKAIIAVDYAGQPCDYDALRAIANRHGLALVADACHALGAIYRNRPVGSLADLNVFSLHPVKHITTGEGGVVTTHNAEYANRMRTFRNHGITTTHTERNAAGSWVYEMVDLGFNYRITDFQCALGLSQLGKLSSRIDRRREIAKIYMHCFQGALAPLRVNPAVKHAYHIFPVSLRQDAPRGAREVIFQALRAEGIGVNVHYIPVYHHPYYRTHYPTYANCCPAAELAYSNLLTLPLFPQMTDRDVNDVVEAVEKVTRVYSF